MISMCFMHRLLPVPHTFRNFEYDRQCQPGYRIGTVGIEASMYKYKLGGCTLHHAPMFAPRTLASLAPPNTKIIHQPKRPLTNELSPLD
ncbi:hypothetical protein RSAG8_03128, partial [Rhizoctonia solani AG-8 WAC10335]